jgi:hypothetical protein
LVGYIASHPAIENVADAKVRNHFGRRARIDTTEQYRRGILARSICLLFIQVIAVFSDSSAKALISFFYCIYDLIRSHFVTLRLRQHESLRPFSVAFVLTGTCLAVANRIVPNRATGRFTLARGASGRPLISQRELYTPAKAATNTKERSVGSHRATALN